MNPRAAINDLLPFQGSPFGQLGYFSKLPYLLSSSDIYLCRSQRQVILYLVSFMLSSTFLTFFQKFFIMYLTSGESGIRTHAPLRTNGFQDRLVMTTSIPLHVFGSRLFSQRHVILYHTKISASTIISQYFQFLLLYSPLFPLSIPMPQKNLRNLQILRRRNLYIPIGAFV